LQTNLARHLPFQALAWTIYSWKSKETESSFVHTNVFASTQNHREPDLWFCSLILRGQVSSSYGQRERKSRYKPKLDYYSCRRGPLSQVECLAAM
jgi:hypothetical protein